MTTAEKEVLSNLLEIVRLQMRSLGNVERALVQFLDPKLDEDLIKRVRLTLVGDDG